MKFARASSNSPSQRSASDDCPPFSSTRSGPCDPSFIKAPARLCPVVSYLGFGGAAPPSERSNVGAPADGKTGCSACLQKCLLSLHAGVIYCLVVVAFASGCGGEDSPEEKARATVETMLVGLREGDGEKVCDSLTTEAAAALSEQQEIGEPTSDADGCEAPITDAAPQAKRVLRALGGAEITDVDVSRDDAIVKTTGERWPLEEVDGEYLVSDVAEIVDAVSRSGLQTPGAP